MLIAIRRFSSTIQSLTQLARTSDRIGHSQRSAVELPSRLLRPTESEKTSCPYLFRNVHKCSNISHRIDLSDTRARIRGAATVTANQPINNNNNSSNSSSNNSNHLLTPSTRARQWKAMEPIVAEFFPDIERHNVLQVTSGAHPIVEQALEKVIDSLTQVEDKRLEKFNQWIKRVVEYNLPQGKRNRLVAVMLAYQSLEQGEITEEKLEKAAVLGWCVELLQAFFLICDDIMDNSVTRRGAPCWYRVEGVNMMAINDAVILEAAIYYLLKMFFRDHPNYIDLMELFHEVSLQTATGQCLDLLSERKALEKNIYHEENYNAIILYKTAFYSFALPIRLGMYLAGISNPVSHKKSEALSLRIGHIFQVQDDYLDCYGDPSIIGKVGTDIVDAKCSWLVVKALQLVSPEERQVLLDNYGKGHPGCAEEAEVKKIYAKLHMDEVFRETEEQAFNEIRNEIEKLGVADTELKTDIFKLLVNKIYRRKK